MLDISTQIISTWTRIFNFCCLEWKSRDGGTTSLVNREGWLAQSRSIHDNWSPSSRIWVGSFIISLILCDVRKSLNKYPCIKMLFLVIDTGLIMHNTQLSERYGSIEKLLISMFSVGMLSLRKDSRIPNTRKYYVTWKFLSICILWI